LLVDRHACRAVADRHPQYTAGSLRPGAVAARRRHESEGAERERDECAADWLHRLFFYRSSQTSSMRQPLNRLLVIVTSPLTLGWVHCAKREYKSTGRDASAASRRSICHTSCRR